MKTIIIDELRRAVLSIRTIIIVLAFLLIDYYAGKYALELRLVLGPDAELEVLFAGFTILTTFFAFILFSGVLSRDMESGAIFAICCLILVG